MPAGSEPAEVIAAEVRDVQRFLSPGLHPTGSGFLSHIQLERQLGRDVRPVPLATADDDRTTESFDAVGKADQARTARRIGSADSVVVNR